MFCEANGGSMKPADDDTIIKPSTTLGTAFLFATQVLLWIVLGVPMLTGIRSLIGEGVISDGLCFGAISGIVLGSFYGLDRLTSIQLTSNHFRQTVWFWTYLIIWGSAVLLFWPRAAPSI